MINIFKELKDLKTCQRTENYKQKRRTEKYSYWS